MDSDRDNDFLQLTENLQKAIGEIHIDEDINNTKAVDEILSAQERLLEQISKSEERIIEAFKNSRTSAKIEHIEDKCEVSVKEKQLIKRICKDIKTLKEYYIQLSKMTQNKYHKSIIKGLINQVERAVFILTRIARQYDTRCECDIFDFTPPKSFCYGIEVCRMNCSKILENVMFLNSLISQSVIDRQLGLISVILTSQLISLNDLEKGC